MGKKKQLLKRLTAFVLTFAVVITSAGFDRLANSVQAAAMYTTLYLVDDTPEHWLGNDSAVIELVDNTYGHDHYIMKKESATKWSVRVPSTTFNVTFNRLSPDKSTQWNSWSAGGRNTSSTYHAITHEHGYWDGTAVLTEGFHEGDVVYLDYYEFADWEKTGASFYVNFTDASKEDNNGADITISSADADRFAPVLLTDEIEEQVFTYTVTAEDEGAEVLRFWRGNSSTLWNYSVTLSYSDYKAGNNCVKVQGWNDTGYVCPYVPRRHITQIDSIEITASGSRKVNRKIDLDLAIEGETELLLQDETQITIQKLDSDGGVSESAEEEDFAAYDTTASAWNHRELIFKESGTYRITAIATDGTDEFTAETTVVIAEDQAPAAGLKLGEEDGELFVRDADGTAKFTVLDTSVSELNDEIVSRIYRVYHDSNHDGEYTEDEIIRTVDGNETSVELSLKQVGNYRIVLNVQESYTDTIPALLGEAAYLTGEISREFEITNEAPDSSMSVKKSKLADIVFTMGNADSAAVDEYAAVTAGVQKRLKELGIEANVSTVSTSALTAQDTFAWKEYDHYNCAEIYSCMEKHIIYDGKDIRMVGYNYPPIKDFLYVADDDSSKKIFEFDLQRDYTDWHSMEGGGFLFNTVVSDEENYIQGYCILVTSGGLQLVQINRTNLDSFRNGGYNNVYQTGRILQSAWIPDLYGNHHFKIIVDRSIITVYDGDTLVINEYTLPDDGIEAYGYGPITSHKYHNCWQQSYFTFKNIVMQTVTGESLSDVVNSHEWTPGTNHYVVNLSETSVPELSDNDRIADTAAAMIRNDAMFFGIGNDNTVDQYNALLNATDGAGETIRLSDGTGETEDSGDAVSVEDAVNQIVERIVADINSKDYTIGYTLAADEKVEYTDTYIDPENDPIGEEIWKYVYDPNVFGESGGEVQENTYPEPITMFTEAGAYEISHMVSDDPTDGNEALSSYIGWSDTDDYTKLILSQHRPVVGITATVTQSEQDSSVCLVNVVYDSYDEDHPSDAKKGIREEAFYYKELGEETWTEGRFPSKVPMGGTYLIKYVVTDIEGTQSRPAVAAVKTNEAREYVEPEDQNPPTVYLDVSEITVEVGSVFYVEASAEDDYGIERFTVTRNGEEIADSYGRFELTADAVGEYTIIASAVDIGGNPTTEARTVQVIDRSDVTPPVIDIISPADGAISGRTEIIGSITDNKQLKSYTVTMEKVVTEEGEASQEPVILASGTEAFTDKLIAVLDIDEMDAGVYRIEFTAEDMAKNTSTVTLLITVSVAESDRIPPAAQLTDAVLDDESGIISVIGSVTDETAVGGYELYLCKEDTDQDILISSGTAEISEGILGTIDTEELEPGTHTLILKAWDSAGNICKCTGSFTYTEESVGSGEIVISPDMDAPVIAAQLDAAITSSGLQLELSGTIDDAHLLSYTVETGRAGESGSLLSGEIIATGTEAIMDSVIAEYTYPEFEPGDYLVVVTAADEAGNTVAVTYTVTITEQGTVYDGYTGEEGDEENPDDSLLNLILSTTSADLGDSVTAYMTYPSSATAIRLEAEGAEVAVSGRTAEITASEAGEITVTLYAVIDGEEKSVSRTVRFYDRSDQTTPVGYFLTPEGESEVSTVTEITGTAMDETSLAYYTLEYRMEGTDEYRQIAYSTEGVEDGVLGELDPTLLLNGKYTLRLTVVDEGGNRLRVERTIYVAGNLKIGNLSLGFTDINANVSGIPLTVTRNYDSRNKASGDFGTGWTMGIQSAKLTESGDISQGYSLIQQGDRLSTGYSLVQTECHDITVTYGDGTSDRFELQVTPERQALFPIYEVEVSFRCVTDKNVKLELAGDNHARVYGNSLVFDELDSHTYILTRKDGTKLYLSPEYGLLKMEDANGNTVSITKSGFRHSCGSSVLFTRDDSGRIIKAEEKNSDGDVLTTVTYAYDSRNDLVSVTDTAGRTVLFTYDDDHNLVDIIDPSGAAVARNIYDDNGRLTATVDADGNRIEYEHDIEGKTETVRDKKGNTTVYTYDDNGNILKTVDALGNVTRSTYDEENHVLTKTDALGNVTTYNYDENGNLETLSSADGVTETLSYSTLNLVTGISLAGTVYASMDYDDSGNLTSMTDAEGNETTLTYAPGGKLSGITDEIGTVRSIVYDADGNIMMMTDGNCTGTTYSYDAEGRCTGVTVKRTEPDGTQQEYTSTYVYDSAGNIASSISNTGMVTSYEYDFRNNRTASVDAAGRRTEYTYDSQDNLVRVSYPDGTFEAFTYDANGNNITATSRTGITVTMTYDKLDRLVKTVYADGSQESYTYDANGNVLTHTAVGGGVTSYTYDCMDRNTSITDAYGNVTTYEYNDRSLLAKTTDALGNVFTYSYDENGNQTGITWPDGTTESVVYDARGRKTSYTDGHGNVTRYTYDGADNLISVMDAMGGVYFYGYDETNELTSVMDAKGNITRYEYDGDGRLVKTINAGGDSAVYTYDDSGSITGYTDYAGNLSTYTYDSVGRLIKAHNGDGDTVYTYDTCGRLETVTDSNGVITCTYDAYDRLESKTTYDLGTILYHYDECGRINSVETKVNGVSAGSTAYEYDRMDRVVRVVGHDGRATLYEYDAIGNRTAVRHEGGITLEYEYDVCSRLIKEIVTDKDSHVLMYYSYAYGDAGEKTQAVEVVRESAEDSTARVIRTTYSYDGLLRLTSEKIEAADDVAWSSICGSASPDGEVPIDVTAVTYSGSIENTYTYDSVSNRTGKTTAVTGDPYGLEENAQAGTTTYTYNALNQLTSAVTVQDDESTTVTYTYDRSGNLLSEHGGDADKAYTYDAANRLTSAAVSSGNRVTIESYTYDYEGNRISKETNEEGRIYYLNDTGTFDYTQVALELSEQSDGTYSVDKYYTRGTELLGVDIRDGDSSIKKDYIMDGHGSVTALAESVTQTVITDTYTYDAYGNLLKQTGTTDNDYLYTGEQYNAATELYYLRARYMSPETGTFLTMDTYAGTLDHPVSLHKYLYASANPVMYTDPSGNFSLSELAVSEEMQSNLTAVQASYLNMKKIMSWANLAVTLYDVSQQFRMLMSGEANFFGLVAAIAKGMIVQTMLNCALTAVLGEAAVMVLKVIGIAQDTAGFVEAVKSGDPLEIIMATLRLVISIFALSCQCFTGDTLVSTADGEKRIDEVQAGDYVWSYDTQSGENVLARVTNVSVTEADTLVHVITSDGEEIETTMYHPFYVKNGENGGVWTAASNLVSGDELQTQDGGIVSVQEVRIERLAECIRVYNLEIEGLHTYYVDGGVLVHNACGGSDTNIDTSVDLTDFRKDHILNNHKYGAGKPNKTEFPQYWSDEKILYYVSDIATNPNETWGMGKWDSPYVIGVREGIEIRVDFYPEAHPKYSGKVSTAYPLNTPQNPPKGGGN